MKPIEKPLMFAIAAMALIGAVAVMAISSSDQAQATSVKAYRFNVKLINANKLVGQVAKLTIDLVDHSGKVVASASNLVTIKGNSVKVPITVKVDDTIRINFARSCVHLANVASNVVCANTRSPVEDSYNDVSLDLRKIRVPL
jgi:hypothetical protein